MMMTLGMTAGHSGGSLASFTWLGVWQQDAINSGNSKLLMIFVGISALALVGQAIALAVIAVGARRAQAEIMGHVTELKGKVMPLVEKSHTLVTDLTPEIKEITAKVNLITGKVHEIAVHAEDIASVAKDKVHEFAPTISAANVTVQQANQTVRDANEKTRQQIDRVNVMMSGALSATERLGKAIEHSITQPGREIAGVVAGMKVSASKLVEHYGPLTTGGLNGLAEKLSSLFVKKKANVVPARPYGAATLSKLPPLPPYTPKPENTPRY